MFGHLCSEERQLLVDLESKVAALVKAQVPKKSASKSENPEFLEAGFVGTTLKRPLAISQAVSTLVCLVKIRVNSVW